MRRAKLGDYDVSQQSTVQSELIYLDCIVIGVQRQKGPKLILSVYDLYEVSILSKCTINVYWIWESDICKPSS